MRCKDCESYDGKCQNELSEHYGNRCSPNFWCNQFEPVERKPSLIAWVFVVLALVMLTWTVYLLKGA